MRGGASRERERAEEEGKADGWDPPVSCPGRRESEASRQIATMGWAGGAGPVARGEKEKREGGQLGLGLRWPVGWWPTRGIIG
jgi:hypothetical protein